MANKNGGLSVRRCEIVTNIEDREGNELFNIENMQTVLDEKSCIKDYCYIIHDKDRYTDADEEKNPMHKSGELKTAHIHLLLRFTCPQKTKYIAQWLGITEPFVSKIHGKWEDAVKYQIHLNAEEKYQYSVEEVHANFDVEKIMNDEQAENPLTEVLNRIFSGEICEYNKATMIDPMLLTMCSRQINEAFKVREAYLMETRKNRQMECIFITGSSSAGKTSLAKKIADTHGLAYFVSSSSNDCLDSYSQEPVLILDDLRPSTLGLADLLKMLDNNTVSSVKSRYKNKVLYCKYIIITTVLDIDTFYSNVFKDENEPIIQLKRRCGTHIRMNRDRIYISVWDSKTMKYTEETEYVNNVLDEYMPKEEKTEEDVINHVDDLIPFIKRVEKDEKQDGFEPITEQMELPFED